MDKRNKQARSALLLLAPLTALLLLAVKLLLPALPSSTIEKDIFWSGKTTQKPVFDIVYTGDSRVYRGIDPRTIEGVTGLKGFNYGFSSAGLTPRLLDRAADLLADKGARILVLGVSVNSFLPSSLSNEHLYTWLNKDRKDRFMKQNIYPLLKGFDAYAVSDFYKFYKGEEYREKFSPATGFVGSDKKPADSSSAILPYLEQFQEETAEQDAVDEFIQKLPELRSKGIRVVLVRIPVTQEMKTIEDVASLGLYEQIRDRVRNLGFECPELNWSDLQSYDGSHLDSESAVIYSRRLGHYLLGNR